MPGRPAWPQKIKWFARCVCMSGRVWAAQCPSACPSSWHAPPQRGLMAGGGPHCTARWRDPPAPYLAGQPAGTRPLQMPALEPQSPACNFLARPPARPPAPQVTASHQLATWGCLLSVRRVPPCPLECN